MSIDPCLFYAPALRVDSVLKGLPFEVGTAALVLDLEDSIPKALKPAGRARLAEPNLDLTVLGLSGVTMRLNSLATPEGLDDIRFLLTQDARVGGLPVERVLIPKVNAGSDVAFYRSLLAKVSCPPLISCFIETVDAVENAFDIAAASDGLCFGQADLAAEMYAPDAAYLAAARSRLCVAAAKYGLPAIDTNSFELWDMEVVRQQSEAAKNCGFTGKAAIHPKQVSTIIDVFTVRDDELAAYRSTIEDYEANERGFAVSKERILAPPFVLKARNMLRLYDRVDVSSPVPVPVA